MVRFLLVVRIKDTLGPESIRVFEATIGAVIGFAFTLCAFILFAFMLLSSRAREKQGTIPEKL